MNRKVLGALGASALALTLAVTISPAIGEPQRPAAVIGRVVDAENHVVRGARVGLMVAPGEVVKWTETNVRGEYEFRPIRAGRYAVGASKPDIGSGHTPVFLAKPGEVTRAPVKID